MRRKNWRLIYTGIVLIAAALGFFLYMAGISHTSNDPKTMMEVVGQVCGVVGGISIAMIIFGIVGKKT